jgi:hypothetical protein
MAYVGALAFGIVVGAFLGLTSATPFCLIANIIGATCILVLALGEN